MGRVTRVAHSKKLNQGKYDQLSAIAATLGKLRADLWRRYGSLSGTNLHYGVVAQQMKGNELELGLTYKLWKNTLKDVIEAIATYRAAAKEKVKSAIRKRTSVEVELSRLYTLLKSDRWTEDPFLHRQMRKHGKHGVTTVNNQIVLEPAMYSSFDRDGTIWLKVQTPIRGQRIAIPTDRHLPFTGNLRLMLVGSPSSSRIRGGIVEIHYQCDTDNACSTKPHGHQKIGIDKGYTEAFTDSDGDRHGEGLGDLLSSESDYLKKKYQNRNRLTALAEAKPHKRDKIVANNLGRIKLDARKALHTKRVRNLVYLAAHSVVDKASMIAAEDLTSPIPDSGKYGKKPVLSLSKDQSRRLSGWTKGIMAEAIESVSQRRGSSLSLVNCAYTSQVDSRHGVLLGTREGDRFIAYDGDVLDADTNAARNILQRLYDKEIKRYTPYRQVKQILQGRTDKYKRMGPLIQDTSCKDINFYDPYQQ